MNTTPESNNTKLKVEDVSTSHIQSFLDFCKIIAILINILFIVLSIISFVTASEVHAGIHASGRTYTYSEVNGAKIGAGIGYFIGGFISGTFLWKFSKVFCGFLYDVKVIRTLIKEAQRNGVLLDVKSIKNQLEKITKKMDDNNVGGKTND